MNWFSETNVDGLSTKRKQHLVEEWGGCEHVAVDASKTAVVTYEHDSFGQEGYCWCASCHKDMKAKQANDRVTCHDCHHEVKYQDTIPWMWHDFDITQGDEALLICTDCQSMETHKKRVAAGERQYAKLLRDSC